MTKRLLSIIIAILMALTVLTSCYVGGDEELPHDTEATEAPAETSAPTATEAPAETDAPETEAPKADLVIKEGMNVNLVYSIDYAREGSSNPYVKKMINFASDLNKINSATYKRITDQNGYSADTVEILLGDVSLPETKKVMEKLDYSGYIVTVEGNKLVVAAYFEEAIIAGIDKAKALIETFTSGGVTTIPGNTFIAETVNKEVEGLPVYIGGNFDTTYVSGGNGNMFIIRETNPDEYRNYLKALETRGFTEYTTTEITENIFATYNNATHTVNAGYYDYENTVRIIIEPLAPAVGLASDVSYTKVTTPSITMLGCGYDKADGSHSHTGLSLIIRLEDGSFVIVDGAHEREEKADQMMKALKELSKDYRKEGEKIVISDWIVTHPHNDHYYMLLDFHKLFLEEFTVKRIVANIISDEERAVAIKTYPNSSQSATCARWAELYTVAEAFGCHVQWVRTGQVLYEAGLKMEILFTIDSFAPRICNAVNTTSLVVKMTFADGTVFMVTGDATGNGLEICAKMYGEYLKSDIVQVSHHGSKTWDNDNGVIMAYNLMAPETLVWPSTKNFYNSSRKNAYNVVLFSPSTLSGGKNPNYKEVYIAGEEYDAVTLSIPHTVGGGYTWKVK